MAKRVVPGSITEPYKKRNGDFSPNLVGLQFTDGATLFTMGNFSITTNITPSVAIDFNSGDFSESFCLENLNITQSESVVLDSNTLNVYLNLDPTNIERYVYFGSFSEFLRVNIEEILMTWKGSLYVTDLIDNYGYSQIKNTVLTYSYDNYTNTSTFLIPSSLTINDYGLIYESNTMIPEYGDISNLSYSFKDYQISNDYGDFIVLGFTGTSSNNQYIQIITSGETFPTLTGSTFGSFKYHLRPNDVVMDKYFFSQLDEFKSMLMNRLVKPKYTVTLQTPMVTEVGVMNVTNRLTWPTTDGFNLDNNGDAYTSYVRKFYDIVATYDTTKTDLMVRRFVSESIIEFDTDGGDGSELFGKKVTKLLRIYGREFDEVKKYADGISFASHVTYNKKDNMADELIKEFATVLGFDTILSFNDNNLLKNNLSTSVEVFSGYSRSMTISEMDIELWRRLIINAWWLYKSKGHRKVIEFYLNLFGIDECLIDFDEIIYIAKDKLNYSDTIRRIANYLDPISGDTSVVELDTLPMDVEGFPSVLPNTPDYYFQMNGFWYNGGNLSSQGNNPHIGPYDYGTEYFDRFRCMVDGFNGAESGITTFTTLTNYFTDYNNGTIENGMLPYGETFAEVMETNNMVSGNVNVISAGSSDLVSRLGKTSFRITFNVIGSNSCLTCPTDLTYYNNGIIFHGLTSSEIEQLWAAGDVEQIIAAATFTKECCEDLGGYSAPLPRSSGGDTDCPDPGTLSVVDGVVYGIYSESCCNSRNIGLDVYWDIKTNQCMTNDPGGRISGVVGGDVISSKDLFGVTNISVVGKSNQSEEPTDFMCWWCPETIDSCSVGSLLENLEPTQLQNLATTLGFDNNTPLEVVAEYFNSLGGCVVTTQDGDALLTPECCQLRGGQQITDDFGNVFCVKVINNNPCNFKSYSEVVIDYNGVDGREVLGDNNTMTEECCTIYKSQVDSSYNYETYTSYGVQKVGCVKSTCPTSVVLVDVVDSNPTMFGEDNQYGSYQILTTDGINSVTESCCIGVLDSLGYDGYFDTTLNKCVKPSSSFDVLRVDQKSSVFVIPGTSNWFIIDSMFDGITCYGTKKVMCETYKLKNPSSGYKWDAVPTTWSTPPNYNCYKPLGISLTSGNALGCASTRTP